MIRVELLRELVLLTRAEDIACRTLHLHVLFVPARRLLASRHEVAGVHLLPMVSLAAGVASDGAVVRCVTPADEFGKDFVELLRELRSFGFQNIAI